MQNARPSVHHVWSSIKRCRLGAKGEGGVAMPARQRYPEISRLSKPYLSSIVNKKSFNEDLARKLCKEKRLEAAIDVVVSLVDYQKLMPSLIKVKRLLDCLEICNGVQVGPKKPGFAMNGHYGLAWKCLQDMQLEGFRPDSVTMLSLLSACSQFGSMKEGCSHFKSTFEGHSAAPWVEHYTCLLDLLVQAGCPTEARSLFETMPLRSDTVGWMSLLQNYQRSGHAKLAHGCFDRVVGYA
ncbi:hypothetical protein GOP47_0009417 [Adiantum capillus-veneris]|uniref:Pentatricopeptide repeat-containing protein n=1 Tax=Adiantum capillus-veneris TaxID=13818 RepID=A0A9D4ZJH7_ADICA|nr:hypothetical protein GOP47_0009417 [Adiantum capillus-veneris]